MRTEAAEQHAANRTMTTTGEGGLMMHGDGMLRLPCCAATSLSLSLRPSVDPGSDSSEDERPNRNTIGDVPLQWYRDEDHVGYDLEVRGGGSAGR